MTSQYKTASFIICYRLLYNKALHNFLMLSNMHSLMRLDSVGQEFRHMEDDLCLLYDVWSLSWDDWNSLGLESCGSIYTHCLVPGLG